MQIDHVQYGVRDLPDAQRWFAEEFGLEAVPGGVHPEMGTENAIISVGYGQYIELLAVADDNASHPLPRILRGMVAAGDRPIGVSLRAPDLDGLATRLGLDVVELSRRTPDDDLLTWRFAGMEAALGPERLPSFVDWGERAEQLDRAHASKAPGGGGFRWLEIGADSDSLGRWLGEPLESVRPIAGEPGVARFAVARGDTEIVIGARQTA